MSFNLRTLFVSAAGLLLSATVSAQTLPAGPLEFGNGTVAVSGDISVSASVHDGTSFFNFTDYDHDALRMVRLDLAATWRPLARFAVLTELRSEDGEGVIPYALYARVRPFAKVPLDIQAGRIPPVFGAFARRSYGSTGNPLIGYPLAYQYLTTLRADSIPGSADELLIRRSTGWQVFPYSVGDQTKQPGVPLISAYRWDTGVEGHFASEHLEAALALTNGTLSHPQVQDNNGGNQLSARVAWKPLMGLVVGGSASRGEFLDRSIIAPYVPLIGEHAYKQTAIGADAEYSRGYWVVQGEWIMSRWELPALGLPLIAKPLTANSAYVEGRYRLGPRYYLAGRVDRLGFSRLTGERRPSDTWDADVERVEYGGGIYLQRNLILRLILQHNWRDGGFLPSKRTFPAAQLTYWF